MSDKEKKLHEYVKSLQRIELLMAEAQAAFNVGAYDQNRAKMETNTLRLKELMHARCDVMASYYHTLAN